MKNGYTYHAVEGEVSGGSYGRAVASVQAGGQIGNLSGYITADAINDAGWRMDTPSSLRRVYADLGARGDQTEFHVTFTGANNNFSADGGHSRADARPELVEHLHAAANDAKSTGLSDGKCDLEAERHVDLSGNCLFSQLSPERTSTATATNAQNDRDVPIPPFSAFQISMARCPTSPRRGAKQSRKRRTRPSVLGEIDRTWTTTNSFGGSVQASSAEKVFGHGNNFTIGLSVDRGLVQFSETAELGTLNANQFPTVQGSDSSSTSPRATSRRSDWAPRRSIPASTRPTRSTSLHACRSRPAVATTSRKST